LPEAAAAEVAEVITDPRPQEKILRQQFLAQPDNRAKTCPAMVEAAAEVAVAETATGQYLWYHSLCTLHHIQYTPVF
jgi:hypothetical protein